MKTKMYKTVSVVCCTTVLVAGAVSAVQASALTSAGHSPQVSRTITLDTSDGTAAPAPIEVSVCPICMGDMPQWTPTETVGKYLVHLCPGNDQAAFDKLSDADRLEKTEAAYAKQQKEGQG